MTPNDRLQLTRYAQGGLFDPEATSVAYSLSRLPPEATRISNRPWAEDRWGFGSLADADQGRVKEERGPAERGGTAVKVAAGFLLYRLVSGLFR